MVVGEISGYHSVPPPYHRSSSRTSIAHSEATSERRGKGHVKSFVDGIMSPFVSCWQPPVGSCVPGCVSSHRYGEPPAVVSPLVDRQAQYRPVSPRSKAPPAYHYSSTQPPTTAPPPQAPQPTTNIEKPHSNDVLCGRGGSSNRHLGNMHFRELVAANKKTYVGLTKKQKMLVARKIVEMVHNTSPPGRFLAKDLDSGLWYDIGLPRSLEKTSQALREKNSNDMPASVQGQETTEVYATDPKNGGLPSTVSFDESGTSGSKPKKNTKQVEPPPIVIPNNLRDVFGPRKAPPPPPQQPPPAPPTHHHHHPHHHHPPPPPPQHQYTEYGRPPPRHSEQPYHTTSVHPPTTPATPPHSAYHRVPPRSPPHDPYHRYGEASSPYGPPPPSSSSATAVPQDHREHYEHYPRRHEHHYPSQSPHAIDPNVGSRSSRLPPPSPPPSGGHHPIPPTSGHHPVPPHLHHHPRRHPPTQPPPPHRHSYPPPPSSIHHRHPPLPHPHPATIASSTPPSSASPVPHPESPHSRPSVPPVSPVTSHTGSPAHQYDYYRHSHPPATPPVPAPEIPTGNSGSPPVIYRSPSNAYIRAKSQVSPERRQEWKRQRNGEGLARRLSDVSAPGDIDISAGDLSGEIKNRLSLSERIVGREREQLQPKQPELTSPSAVLQSRSRRPVPPTSSPKEASTKKGKGKKGDDLSGLAALSTAAFLALDDETK